MAGRLLMVGLPGPELDDALEARLREIGPGGAILFARNLVSPAQTQRLLARLRTVLPPPSLLAVDQEGGRVSRLEPWIGPTPTAAALARAGEVATREFAGATGALLRALGFNLDFAPVVDLCEPDVANGIGNRSFGTDPQLVSQLAGAFLDALQAAGIAGCLKHFPGLGPTAVDSHVELPTSQRTRRELERLDLHPFARLAGRAACVMVGHGHYPALDDRGKWPATLSRPVVSHWLRSRLGFRGLVVSDDLEMGAVASLDREGQAAVSSVEAGCDLLLYCRRLELAETAAVALAERAAADSAFGERLEDAARATERTARRWTDGPAAGAGDWNSAMERVRQASRLC
jgi:beta-N-acetylhexosaminidase